MLDTLLQIGATKLLVSAVLAGLAWLVQRRFAHSAVTHPLWLLVLVSLLLPAVVAVPVLPGGTGSTVVIADNAVTADDAAVAGHVAARVTASAASLEGTGPATPLATRITENGKTGLAIGWLAGTALLLGWTLVRTLRFRRWLARTSHPAPPDLRQEVSEIGCGLELSRLPEVHTTTARVSPMVCWIGGRVRLVIPSFLLASLDWQELRTVLAHELAHVRRRDHLVRWIEWLACSAFWWNPVAWWARRELRVAEEASCDAIGMAAIKSTPRTYAKSLLRVVELMSEPPTPPAPAFASGAASGRDPKALERRLRMLISGKSTGQAPRWIRAAGAAAAVCLLPLGLVYCGFADQPTPTALGEAPEVAALADEPAGEQSTDSIPLSWKLDLPLPVPLVDTAFTYYIAAASGTSGPHAVANHTRLPSGCIWVFEQRRGDSWKEPLKTCADELALELQAQEGFEPGAVCVGRNRNGIWSGHCQFWGTRASNGAPEVTAGEVFAEIDKLRRILEE